MKKLTLAMTCFVGLLGNAVAADGLHGCPESATVYSALSEDKTSAIELCSLKQGFRYTFGPIGKPNIAVINPLVEFSFDGDKFDKFELKDKNKQYIVMENKQGDAKIIAVDLQTQDIIETTPLINDSTVINNTYFFKSFGDNYR